MVAILPLVVGAAAGGHWLVDPPSTPVTVTDAVVGGRAAVIMANGLVSRTFLTTPNWATWSMEVGGEDLLRAVQPEASFELDGSVSPALRTLSPRPTFQLLTPHRQETVNATLLTVGGVNGTSNFAFKNSSDPLSVAQLSYTYRSHRTVPIAKRFEWVPGSRFSEEAPWPPLGLGLEVQFDPPSAGLPSVNITYEMYQGLPVMSKKVTLGAVKSGCHRVRGLMVERLAMQETHLGRNNHFDTDWAWFQGSRISLFTSFARQPQYPCQTGRDGWVAGCSGGAGVFGIIKDPDYKTSYQFAWPSLLVAGLSAEPACSVRLPCIEYTFAEFCMKYGECPPGESYAWEQVLCDESVTNTSTASTPSTFDSFTVFELFHGPDADQEEKGLATKQLHRKLAPQVTENPIYMHCTKSDAASLEACVDQAAEVGFEMVIISFGAGFDLESTDPEYIASMRQISDYASAKGIQMGGYDLLAHTRSRGHNYSIECIGPDGQPDGSTCLASQGSDGVFRNILNFVEATNWSSVETDGPYEGESCGATNHSHHRNLQDSVFQNWRRNMEFYHSLQERGVYINAPDPYFLDGTHKDGMGYDEEQWGRPRWQWILQARQQIYDETYHKIASMGWQFVPIAPYNGGPSSVLEPICDHLHEYEFVLSSYLGTGTQACYRGTRLYDPSCPASKALVSKWVSWFKEYRTILNSDLVHLRRPDLAGIDAMLHVNSNVTRTDERGMLVIWNQTPQHQALPLTVPLFYTGLTTSAMVSAEGGAATKYMLARDYSITVNVSMAPMSVTWLLIK